MSNQTENLMLGFAFGDAFGLVGEGLPKEAARKLWKGSSFPTLFFGRVIVSDDTYQTILVANAWHRSEGDLTAFRKRLRRSLIAWFWTLPPGVGFGTARSILKLTLGFSTGIGTAGNGAAMRAVVLGALIKDPDQREEFVRASSELTHRDPRAVVSAIAVAHAAATHPSEWEDVFQRVNELAQASRDFEYWKMLRTAFEQCLGQGSAIEEFAARIGSENGVSGYSYTTVAVALYAWARMGDPLESVREVWCCGGDTDTVGAIAGGLVFAASESSPPEHLLRQVFDLQLTVTKLRGLEEKPIRFSWLLLLIQNLVLLPAILIYAIVLLLPRKYGLIS